MKNVPVSVSLFDDPVTGVIGEKRQVLEFAKGLIIQLAALYSYDEVKMVFLYAPSDAPSMDFVKWLPHAWSDDKDIRFLVTDQTEGKEVSSYSPTSTISSWTDPLISSTPPVQCSICRMETSPGSLRK